ncbi:NAD(P)-dependent oxidoreductase [Cycloclasticus sp. 46_120_T64]|nr:NAD(P)-dependent oxidoreductase [Cycloclasticus sp. 46_120_T64]
MASILIVGCGDVGGALALKLAAEGHQVTGLKRQPNSELSAIPFIKADVSQLDELAGLDFNYDQLVYILSPSAANIAAYKAVFTEGVDNLLKQLAEKKPTIALTFVSSTRVYGQDQGEWLNEDSKTDPSDERGKIILTAEKKFLAFNGQSTVIRFSGIYGRSNHLLNKLKAGAAIQQEPCYYTNRIHREDCIAVLDFLLNKKLQAGLSKRIYLATDDEPVSQWQLASYLCAKFKYPEPSPQHLAKEAGTNKRLDNAWLKQEGYSFRFSSYKQGYREG